MARQYDVGQTVAASFRRRPLHDRAGPDECRSPRSLESDIGTVKVRQPSASPWAYPDQIFRASLPDPAERDRQPERGHLPCRRGGQSRPDAAPNRRPPTSRSRWRACGVCGSPTRRFGSGRGKKTTTSPEERAASLGTGGGTAAVARQADQSRGGGASGASGGGRESGGGGGRRGRGGPPTEQTVYKLTARRADPVKIKPGYGVAQVVSGQVAVRRFGRTGAATTKVDSTGALPGRRRSPAGGAGGRVAGVAGTGPGRVAGTGPRTAPRQSAERAARRSPCGAGVGGAFHRLAQLPPSRSSERRTWSGSIRWAGRSWRSTACRSWSRPASSSLADCECFRIWAEAVRDIVRCLDRPTSGGYFLGGVDVSGLDRDGGPKSAMEDRFRLPVLQSPRADLGARRTSTSR